METVICPVCDHENSFDPEESDVIVCDGCNRILDIYQDDDGYCASVMS